MQIVLPRFRGGPSCPHFPSTAGGADASDAIGRVVRGRGARSGVAGPRVAGDFVGYAGAPRPGIAMPLTPSRHTSLAACRKIRVGGKVREPTCKPGSVEDSHSSATHVTVRL